MPPSLDLLRLLAHKQIDRATGDDAIQWAIRELERGNESESLAVLACEQTPARMSEAFPLVVKAITELGYDSPADGDVRLAYLTAELRKIANGIVANEISPLVGRDAICDALRPFCEADDNYLDNFARFDCREWWEMYGGYDPESLDRLAETELIPHIMRYASRLLGNDFESPNKE